MRLKDKVAIITGAASGIGRAMAVRFAKEGAKVVVADVQAKKIDETVAEITAAGGDAVGSVTDVSSNDSVVAMVKLAKDKYGRIDILCNNAGILDQLVPLVEVTDELWNKVMGVNLNGPFFTCRAVLPIMIEQGGGAILNTASVASVGGGRGGPTYTASKHAVQGLTKNIAWYYADKGIRCNAIAPGNIATPLALKQKYDENGIAKMSPYFATMPRYGQPDELANAALFLASDEASYVNGATFFVDFGWSIF